MVTLSSGECPMATIAEPTLTVQTGGSFLIESVPAEDVFTPEDFDESHIQVRRTTKRFMDEEVMPRADAMESKEPGIGRDLLVTAGELGLLGVLVPERYDGLEMDLVTKSIVSECISHYASFSTTYGAHAAIGTLPLVFFGTEDQKRRYLPRLVTAEIVGAYCLSEPQAGSDALNSLTRAELTEDGRHYVLNGQKMWISNGGWADLYTVFAKVDGKHFTAFLVERGMEGVSPGPEERKMGLLGSSTTPLFLDNVKVPVENLLGEIGRGHIIAFNILNIGRLELAASCVGGAKKLIEESAVYAQERKAFGKPISEFGLIRQKLADMTARTYCGESLLYRTAGMIGERLTDASWDTADGAQAALKAVEEYAAECSIAKVLMSEEHDYVADEAVQIHGGYGYHRDYAVERAYRDSRINRIYEGTNEINRLLTTGMLLKRAAQGRLDLLGAVQRAGRTGDADTGDSPVGPQRALVDRARRATLTTLGVAWRRFGKKLERHQEVVAALADMAAALYAADSALLRTEKLHGSGRPGGSADLLTLVVHEMLGRLRESGAIVYGACADPSGLEAPFHAFERSLRTMPPNLPATRDRVAARVLESRSYTI